MAEPGTTEGPEGQSNTAGPSTEQQSGNPEGQADSKWAKFFEGAKPPTEEGIAKLRSIIGELGIGDRSKYENYSKTTALFVEAFARVLGYKNLTELQAKNPPVQKDPFERDDFDVFTPMVPFHHEVTYRGSSNKPQK